MSTPHGTILVPLDQSVGAEEILSSAAGLAQAIYDDLLLLVRPA